MKTSHNCTPLGHKVCSNAFWGAIFWMVTAAIIPIKLFASENSTQIANPAAQFCIQSGGEHSIEADESGGKYGVCTLDDGRRCDAWALMRGECGPATTAIEDPFAYCATLINSNIISAGANPDLFPAELDRAMIKQGYVSAQIPEAVRQQTLWRCLEGELLVCFTGANLPCAEQADSSTRPTNAMLKYCRAHPGAKSIPATVTGRATLYSWHCADVSPTVTRQVFSVDKRGYLAEIWKKINPPTKE